MTIAEAVLGCCDSTERAAILESMRQWAMDCQWRDCEPGEDTEEFMKSLPESVILAGVQRHYDGGVLGFLLDWSPAAPAEVIERAELGGWQAPEGGAR